MGLVRLRAQGVWQLICWSGVAAVVAFALQKLAPLYAFTVLALPVAILVAQARPGIFLLVGTGIYAVLQVVLQGVEIANVARANQLLIAGIVALLGLRALFDLRREGEMRRWIGMHTATVCFVAWSLVGILGTKSAECYPVAGRLVLAAVFLFVGYHFGVSQKEYIWAAVALLSFTAASTSLFIRLTSHDSMAVYRIGALRTGGSVGGAVATAAAVFVGTPVFVDYLLGPGRRPAMRWIGAAGLAGILVTVATTLTRAYMLGLVVFGLLFVLLVARNLGWTRKRQLGLVVIPGVLLVGVLFVVPARYVEARFQDFGGVSGAGIEDRTGSGRGRIWKEGIGAVETSSFAELLVGHGLTSLNDALQGRLGYRKDAHNSYIQVLYDRGIVGLVLYGIVLLAMWRATAVGFRAMGPHYLSVGVWHAYLGAYMVSFLAFNAYVYSGPPNFFSFLGIGAAAALRGQLREPGKKGPFL